MVLEEENLTEATLLHAVKELSDHRQDYLDAMNRSPQSDAIRIILDLIGQTVS